jgi:ubiquinone/menaquinone biosynthesis C-methylase UbiE
VNVERLARMESVVESVAGPGPRLLDVGCGTGLDLAHWLATGWPAASLAGVDLVPDRIRRAQERCPGVDLQVTSGSALPFATGSFDIATAVTVFSSILDPDLRRELFGEMCRVVRPGGAVIVYDFVIRNPRNRDVVAMTPALLRQLGRRPDASIPITPLIQLVALGARLGRRAADLAMRFAPRTHRLSRWSVPAQRPRG